jgi:hypothetical protein
MSASETTTPKPEGLRWIPALVLALAFAFRLLHLGGPLDIPDWRQGDTGYMALRMAGEWPPDLLHPKAPYRGAVDVKAAEFPIYPALVGLVYRALGGESLPAARVVTLLFFIGSLLYFHATVRRVFGAAVARHAAAVYALLPLGIPYSRMVHPDFCIIFFAHAYAFHALDFIERRRASAYALATLAATAAFLMKAPYVFYFAMPLAVYAWLRPGRRIVADTLGLGSIFIVPFLAAMWFNGYRILMEAAHEESILYPMKWTAESLNARFFGTPAQRLFAEPWIFFTRRLVILAATLPGALLALAATLFAWRWRGWTGYAFLAMLWLGTLAYLLLVFPIVTSDHDYYSLPFLAPLALAIALTLARLGDIAGPGWRSAAAVVAAYLALAAGSAYGLQRGPFLYSAPYFTHDWPRIEAARVMAAELPERDLVISVGQGRSTGWSDPRILYMANRRGWAIEMSALDEAALALYRSGGARRAAVLMTPDHPPVNAELGVLAPYPRAVHDLRDPSGRAIGWLVIVDLPEPAPGS